MATENMVKAGKGGLTFASDWDSTIEYDRLTGVRYDNKLFFSKKPVPIGTIPEDGEYWFLAYEGLTDEEWEALLNGTQQVGDSAKLGGKDASEYEEFMKNLNGQEILNDSILETALSITVDGDYNFKLGGGAYTAGDLPSESYRLGQATIKVRGGNGAHTNTTVILWGVHNGQALRKIAVNYYTGTAWTGWNIEAVETDLANYLPLSGGRLSKASAFVLELQNTVEGEPYAWISYYGKNSRLGTLGFFDVDRPIFYKNDFTQIYDLLHTGNKPSGTYTGNGSATERKINIGGAGSVIAVWANSRLYFVTPGGTVGGTAPDNTKNSATAIFANETLVIKANSSILNESGVTYWWQVL